jgi:hypothetical protein
MKKTLGLTFLALVLVTSLGFAPAAFAADSSTDVNATGMGKLQAQGDGIATLYGKGTIELSGSGTLWVKDNVGDARIDVTGYGNREEFPDGWIQYASLRGTGNIKGSSIRVALSGVDINLSARGRGGATLWGHGIYTINGISGQWGAGNFSRPLIISSAE